MNAQDPNSFPLDASVAEQGWWRAGVLAARVAEALANGADPDPYDMRWLDWHLRMLQYSHTEPPGRGPLPHHAR